MKLLPALVPVVGDLARRDLDEIVADGRLQIGQLRHFAGRSVDRVLDDVAVADLLDAGRRKLHQLRQRELGVFGAAADRQPDHRTSARRRRPQGCPRPSAGEGCSSVIVAANFSSSSRCSSLRLCGTRRLTTACRSPRVLLRRPGQAVALDLDFVAVRRAADDFDLGRPVERVDLERRAEHRVVRVDVDDGVELRVLAMKALVVRDVDNARRGRPAVRRSRRRGRGRRRGSAGRRRCRPGSSTVASRSTRTRPLPPHSLARRLDDLAVSVADVADRLASHLTEHRAGDDPHAAGAAALVAGLDLAAGLGALAVAVVAGLDRLVVELALDAGDHLVESRSSFRPPGRRPAGATFRPAAAAATAEDAAGARRRRRPERCWRSRRSR